MASDDDYDVRYIDILICHSYGLVLTDKGLYRQPYWRNRSPSWEDIIRKHTLSTYGICPFILLTRTRALQFLSAEDFNFL